MLGQNDHIKNIVSIDLIFVKGHSSFQNYHLTKMTSHRKLGAKCESYNKIKNFLLKTTRLSPWPITSGSFFAICAIFVSIIFCGCNICLFQENHLSSAIFVRCHYLQIALRDVFPAGWHFWVFFYSYMHKGIFPKVFKL